MASSVAAGYNPASRCAFWLGFIAMINSEPAKASGWLARAGRVLEGQPECVEHAYLLLPEGYRAFHSGDLATALARFGEAAAASQRYADRDLAAVAMQGLGRTLIRQGEVARGMALLDEAMVAVTAGEVSPLNAGAVFCSVLEACGEVVDLERAQEWTSALDQWCASQPDLVPYRGQCLVRRSELLQLHGDWSGALEWALRAAEHLSSPAPKPGVGAAFYQVGEVHRLRGRWADSEEAYQQAATLYRGPAPGMALLQLAQGRIEAARASIRRMAGEALQPGPRAKILDAYVQIALAANDLEAARPLAAELAEIAGRWNVPYLSALSARTTGALLLAEGNPAAALLELKRSWELWCDLGAPHEAALVRCLTAQACSALGDLPGAALEAASARQTFEHLGAAGDLARVEALLAASCERTVGSATDSAAGPLTGREVEVLKLVAAGLTNRAIANKLHISEKTVARHLSNIFARLDLPSRTAAAAYAYNHGLV
jgi:DNA-binding CsgD family transcriptional regulator